MESLSQAKKLIKEAQRILILTSSDSSIDSLGSALSLSYSLNDAGKIVKFFPKKILGEYSSLFPEKAVPEKFLISIKNKEISELYYEKRKQILNIYLSSGNGNIGKDDIRLSQLKSEVEDKKDFDLIIALGLENLEQIGDFYENNFKLFYQTPILNIDNRETNNKFGNTNLIVEDCPISGILIKIIKSFNIELSQNIRTWLLAGIIGFSQKNQLNFEATEDAISLMKEGVNYEKIINFFSSPQKDSEAKLLEQVLKNIEISQKKGLVTFLLEKKDFVKAKSSPKELAFALKVLANKAFRFPTFLLLWKSSFQGLGVRGIFYSLNSKTIKRILENFSGQVKGRAVLFRLREDDLKKAKEKIVEII